MFEFGHQNRLDAAMEEAKKNNTGVIALVVHTADILNCMPGFATHPNKYKVTSIANLSNSAFYQYIINTSDFERLWVYPSISFSRIKKPLIRQIKKGYICVIYQDYSNKSQLRVPMIRGKFPYLIHTSQSAQKLHKLTDGIILPVITTPNNGIMGRSKFEVLDNTEIMRVARKYKDAPEKEYHGRLSTAINNTIYPWIRAYAHCWEEITGLATKRITDSLKFYDVSVSLKGMVEAALDKVREIIEISWEPDRPDQQILDVLDEYREPIVNALNNSEKIFELKKEKVDLSKMGAIDEILTLLDWLNELLRKNREDNALEISKEFQEKIRKLN